MRGMTNSPFTGHWTFGLQLDLEVTSQSANANEAFDRDLLCKQKKTTIIELHYVPKLCNVVHFIKRSTMRERLLKCLFP